MASAPPKGAVHDLLWYYIAVDQDQNQAEPVKQRGPYAMSEFRKLWQQSALDEDTYVWADGMDDFSQVKAMHDLRAALATEDACSSALSGLDVNLSRATWYYKDSTGHARGPAVVDTLRIMWDFSEVTERTPVFTAGMKDYAALRDVPPLFKALALGDRGAAGAYHHVPDVPPHATLSTHAPATHRAAASPQCPPTPPTPTAAPPLSLSREPSSAATRRAEPHRADGSPSWAELDAKWEQLVEHTQAIHANGAYGRGGSGAASASWSPLPSGGWGAADSAWACRGTSAAVSPAAMGLGSEDCDDARSSEVRPLRLRYPSDGGATAGRLAEDGAAVTTITGGLQQLLHEQLASMEAGFDERRRELTADYDRCQAELAAQLRASEAQLLVEEGKRRALQEEREATQRERAELEASRDELGARGSRLEGELDTLRRQLEAQRAAMVEERQLVQSFQQRRRQLESDVAECAAFRAAVLHERESLARQQAALNTEKSVAVEERAVYEREKKNLEQEREKLARERQSVFEHVRSLEGYKELNKDMLERERGKLAEERERVGRELEAERRQFDVQRTDQARKTRQLQHSLSSAMRSAKTLSPPQQWQNNGEMEPAEEWRPAPPSLPYGRPFPPALPPATSSSSSPSSALLVSRQPSERAVMTLRVYAGPPDARSWVGEVLIGNDTTVGELRRVVGTRYQLPTPFHLHRRDMPIPPGQDHHLAFDFFASEAEDYVCVTVGP